MKKAKYAISKEFAPWDRFTAPVNRPMIFLARRFMRVPGSLFRDKELRVTRHKVFGYKGGALETLMIVPKGIPSPMPCLVYFHGGGFIFDASWAHYAHAVEYAKKVGCAVCFPRYRLAPKYCFPYPQEDSFAALTWLLEHAEEMGIDKKRIGLGGDSAGGMLAVAMSFMAKDRGLPFRACFHLLLYPFLDGSGQSESAKRYTDVPMWSASSTKKLAKIVHHDLDATPLPYRSPLHAKDFSFLPPAYIEVAEFDALHDDGLRYRDILDKEDIPVELHEPKGTIHGFDTKMNAPTTRRMVEYRVEFMKRMFADDCPEERKPCLQTREN